MMREYEIWLNGEYYPRSEARISMLDRGFKLSDLEAYFPVSPYDVEKTNTEVHYLGYYIKWHPQEVYYYSVENSNFLPNVRFNNKEWIMFC